MDAMQVIVFITVKLANMTLFLSSPFSQKLCADQTCILDDRTLALITIKENPTGRRLAFVPTRIVKTHDNSDKDCSSPPFSQNQIAHCQFQPEDFSSARGAQ